MKIYVGVIIVAILSIANTTYGQGFIFKFVGYDSIDTAYLQFGPDYRSPRYPVLVNIHDEAVYENDTIGNILLAKIYANANYGIPFVLERGKVHIVHKDGYVTGSRDNNAFQSIYDSIWGGTVFDKILEASRLRDSATTEKEKKFYYDLLIKRHNARDRMVKHFLETDTLGVGLYIAYVLRLTATPSELNLWLDNHKRFGESVYYKRMKKIYLAQRDTDIGMKLANFQAVDRSGNKFDLYSFLENFKGEAIVLDFWASWCHACRAKSPKLLALYNEYKDTGMAVIAISSDKTVEPWLKAIKQDNTGAWIHVIDTANTTGKQYGIPAIPKTFVLNKEGVVQYYGVGGLADEKEVVERLLK